MASIEIAPGWLDAVQRYVDGLLSTSIAAAESAAKVFKDSVVDQARQSPDWEPLADHISMWSDDGDLIIGVHDPMFTSQASVLEYGTEEVAPQPVLRNLGGPTRAATEAARRVLEENLGPWNVRADGSPPT